MLLFLVEATGFEPAALCSQSRCATKLRYASILNFSVSFRFAFCLGRLPKQIYSCGSQSFFCALGRHRNFDRCAISPSLHRPPDAVGLNATKLRYASIYFRNALLLYTFGKALSIVLAFIQAKSRNSF